MALEAHVQGNFTFAGVKRRPGDVINAEDLAKTTLQQRDALVNAKLIVLSLEGAPTDPDERVQHLVAAYDRLDHRLSLIEAALNEAASEEEAVEGAAPRRARRTNKEA